MRDCARQSSNNGANCSCSEATRRSARSRAAGVTPLSLSAREVSTAELNMRGATSQVENWHAELHAELTRRAALIQNKQRTVGESKTFTRRATAVAASSGTEFERESDEQWSTRKADKGAAAAQCARVHRAQVCRVRLNSSIDSIQHTPEKVNRREEVQPTLRTSQH